jgi:hypothetical protein
VTLGKAGALLAGLAACAALVSGAAASPGAAPPAGALDPAAMVLKAEDFSKGKVEDEGYGDVSAVVESSFARLFSGVVYRGKNIPAVASVAEVVKTEKTASSALTTAARTLSTKKGRTQFGAQFLDGAPKGTKATVGLPHSLRIGDGSLEIAVTLVTKDHRMGSLALAYIRVGRVFAVLELSTAGRPAAIPLVKGLGTVVVKRTHLALLPANSALPTITPSGPLVGLPATASPGTWTGSKTFTYQWLHCDAAGGTCASIAGATGKTYTPTATDVGATLRVAVTAHGDGGSVTVRSAATAPVGAPAPPVNTAPPTISGTAQQGQTLTASPGTWSGSPPTFAYQWQHCDAAATTCTDIGGATAATYVPTAIDAGFAIRVVVTASGPAGTASAASAPTAVVP